MVEYCNTQGNMLLFPQEVTAIAAVLQRDHYRFKWVSPSPSAAAGIRCQGATTSTVYR